MPVNIKGNAIFLNENEMTRDKKGRIDWRRIFEERNLVFKYDYQGMYVEIKPIKREQGNKLYVEYNGKIRKTNSNCLKYGDILSLINEGKWHKTVVGLNDFATLHLDICKKYSIDINEAKVNSFSEKEVDATCPYCGAHKTYKIRNLTRKGFRCNKCSDGKSFGEKFIFDLLEQLNLDFKTEAIFDWCENKRYDFYFEHLDKKYIIECNGVQHYKKAKFFNDKIKLDKIQNNDKEKQRLAELHGIHYIIIDAMESNLESIKESILNSDLNKIFDLSNINWKRCLKYTMTSKMIEACRIRAKYPNCTCGEIADIIKMSAGTVKGYLTRGAKLDPPLCYYDPEDEHTRGASRGGNSRDKHIIVFKDGKIVDKFKTVNDIIGFIETNYNAKTEYEDIMSVYHGVTESYLCFNFMMSYDYRKLKDKYAEEDFADWKNKIQPELKRGVI